MTDVKSGFEDSGLLEQRHCFLWIKDVHDFDKIRDYRKTIATQWIDSMIIFKI